MASLLESIIGVRGYPTGYRDKIRSEILAPVEEKLQERADKRRMGQSQEAYGKAAAALTLNGPDIGAIALLARADPTAASSLLTQAAQNKSPMGQEMYQAQLGSERALERQRLLAGDRDLQEIQQAEKLGPLNLQAAQALIQSRQASAAASRANAEAARFGKISQVQGTLNQRFLSQMDAPTQVADAVQQVDAALATGDSLGALAATIKLAKILDPTSVVREGEVTTVQGGIGVGAQLMNNYNKLFGSGFNPAAAQTFQKVTKSVAAPVLQRGLRIEDEIRKAAAVMEADPNMAATGIGWPSQYVRRYLQGMPDPGASADIEL